MTSYSMGYYDDAPKEKDAYEDAVYDIWSKFEFIRDHVDFDFFLGRRSLNNAVRTKDEAQRAMDVIEKEYPQLFENEEEEE